MGLVKGVGRPCARWTHIAIRQPPGSTRTATRWWRGRARRALDLGLYLSLPRPLTYPNAKKLPGVVARLPLDRLLVETDAPCSAPHPHRGERSEPAYVRFIAESLARVQGKSLEEVARVTTENAKRLFRLEGAWRRDPPGGSESCIDG